MPYQRIDHQCDAKTNLAPPSLKVVHPLNKAPVIFDGDIILYESSTVMEYIIDQDNEKHFRPEAGTKEYYQYMEWSHFAEGSLGLPVMYRLLMGRETRNGDQPMDNYIAKEVR